MRNSHRDLVAVCLWAVMAAIATSAHDTLPRVVAGAPLVLFLPGYALLKALGFEAKSRMEWLAIAVGTSIAVTVGGGFVLNSLGLLTPFGWALWLALATTVPAGVTIFRTAPVPLPPWEIRWPHGLDRRSGVRFGAAALVTVAAILLAAWDHHGPGQFEHTEFWMLPGDATRPGMVTIGIRNTETTKRHYDVEITLDGRLVAMWRSLPVDPGQTLTREISMPPPADHSQRLEAWLFKDNDRSRIYRKVWLVFGNNQQSAE